MTDAQPPVPLAPPPQIAVPEVPGKRRAEWVLPAIISAGILLVLFAGAGIAYAVLAAQRTPEAVTSAFLGELATGDALGAQALLTDIPGTVATLVQPDTYEATTEGRVTGFTIVSSRADGETASVLAEVEQGGETSQVELTLERVGTELVVFPLWRVSAEVLPTVYVSYARPDGMGLMVNGQELTFTGASVQGMPALPGTYLFEPSGETDSYTADPVEVTLALGAADDTSVLLEVALTEAGTASAQAAVDAFLDGCLAQAALAPGPNCGFSIAGDGASYTNIRWTLLTRPTVSFGVYRSDDGWAVVSESGGSMRLDADFSTATQYGTASGTITDFRQSGAITSIDDAGVAVFESVVYR